MTQLIFTQIPIEELKSVISDVVKSELQVGLRDYTPNPLPEDLLTRKETANLLGISLPSLHSWTIEGKIPAYRIGTRVRYKRSEVERSLTQIKSLKK